MVQNNNIKIKNDTNIEINEQEASSWPVVFITVVSLSLLVGMVAFEYFKKK